MCFKSASSKVFKRGAKIIENEDLKGEHDEAERVLTRHSEDEKTPKIAAKGLVFSFKDVSYSADIAGTDKVLLNNISGVVTPGQLTALMVN